MPGESTEEQQSALFEWAEARSLQSVLARAFRPAWDWAQHRKIQRTHWLEELANVKGERKYAKQRAEEKT